jgi:glyoxylase-like metal-dependent hydrolase (beta-lactamase superfamily II)
MIDTFWLFHCGYLRIPGRFLVAGDPLELRKLPFMAAVAVHRDRGPVLIDAPFGHEGPQNAGELLGSLLQRGGLTFKREWGVIARLEQLGFRPAEVRDILLTHLHWDHTGGLKHLAHASFHVSAQEWAEATRVQASLEATTRGYAPADYRALEGRVSLWDVGDLEPVGAGIDVFGDGSIEVVALPGHTSGHVGYRVKMADGRTIFHVGDSIFCANQVRARRDLGFMPRTLAVERSEAETTLHALRKWSDATPDAVLVPSHDYDLIEACIDQPIAL